MPYLQHSAWFIISEGCYTFLHYFSVCSNLYTMALKACKHFHYNTQHYYLMVYYSMTFPCSRLWLQYAYAVYVWMHIYCLFLQVGRYCVYNMMYFSYAAVTLDSILGSSCFSRGGNLLIMSISLLSVIAFPCSCSYSLLRDGVSSVEAELLCSLRH